MHTQNIAESNAKLAKDYRRYVDARNQLPGSGTKIDSNIKKASVDIAAHFSAHGTLENLPVTGIGPKTKEVLQGILSGELEKLVVQARHLSHLDRVNLDTAMTNSRYPGRSTAPKQGDTDAGWDNAVRLHEKN